LRAAQDLDPLDVEQVAHRDAGARAIGVVDEQSHGGFEIRDVGQVAHATDAQRRGERVRVAFHFERGHLRSDLRELGDAGVEQALCAERADGHRHVLERLLAPGGRHDDLLDLLPFHLLPFNILRTGDAGAGGERREQDRSHSLL